MLIYVKTILNIALINFIMIVKIWSCDCFNYCDIYTSGHVHVWKTYLDIYFT